MIATTILLVETVPEIQACYKLYSLLRSKRNHDQTSLLIFTSLWLSLKIRPSTQCLLIATTQSRSS